MDEETPLLLTSEQGLPFQRDINIPKAPLWRNEALRAHSKYSIRNLWQLGYKTKDEIAQFNPKVQEYYTELNEQLEDYREAAMHHSELSETDRTFLASLGDDVTPPSNNNDNNNDNDNRALALAYSHSRASRQLENEQQKEVVVRRAVISSNIANAFLLVAQVFAFTHSGSLAVLACFIDAVLDFISGILIYTTWYMKRKRDKHRYPVGRERLEPLGILAMACLMTAATLLTLEESVGALVTGKNGADFIGFSWAVSAAMVVALVTKLALFIYCSGCGDPSVLALREDHRNDVLSNATSIVTVFLAQKFFWWLDPIGGILISCLIIRNWVAHSLEHCDQLLGKAASKNTINTLTFMACNHPGIKLIDTVRAYHVRISISLLSHLFV